MNNIETMKLALEAFGEIAWSNETEWQRDRAKQAITSLRQAIEQAQQAEPWEKFCDSNCVWTDHHPDCKLAERLPLTDEEIAEFAERMEASDPTDSFWREFARAIEAAHGIKGAA